MGALYRRAPWALGMSDLPKRSGEIEKKLEAAEAARLEASEALETVEA